MCLLVLHNQPDKLVLAANRDEFYRRPTKNAHWWEEYPNLLAGKDLQAGGTWMGVTKEGRIAAVTNFRKFPQEQEYVSSRGELVKKFLTSNQTAEEYYELLVHNGKNYDGFNLLFGSLGNMFYYSNRGTKNGKVEFGTHGLSNHLLDTPWPKVEKAKEGFSNLIEESEISSEKLFQLMQNKEKADTSLLPDTGIGKDWEEELSSIFIETESYGTRCTTYLEVDSNKVLFLEKTHPSGEVSSFEFTISTNE